uniref:aromatic-ring-hydroxylating dioxygenase subunit beta n=2 Tax=Pseudomonas aeruginosa TaxID=287 RepID=UPI00062C7299
RRRVRERGCSIQVCPPRMLSTRSRTRRLVGNVRLKRVEGELVSSRSNFVVHQFRNREAWNFVGEASHVLRDGPEGLRIVSREIRLDHETISAQRRISIIL